MTVKYSGADWIEFNRAAILRTKKNPNPVVPPMSQLGKAVANLLGDVFAGIYHLDQGALMRVEWSNTHHIVFNLSWRSMATFDDDYLTRLVVLCHDRMIRMSIDGCGPHTTKLIFHQRNSRTGDIGTRYPTMEDHITIIRSNYSEEPTQ